MSSTGQLARDSFEDMTPELWIMVLEQLTAPRVDNDRALIYYEHQESATWNPLGISHVPWALRLVSRQLNALTTPFIFARYILNPKLCDVKYDGDPTVSRVKSLVREYTRCVVIWCHLPWLSVAPFLAECKALQDLEWTYSSKQLVDPEVDLRKMLQQLSHLRLHFLSRIEDPKSFEFVPTPNITTLSLNITVEDHLTELCRVLLASKSLRTLNLQGTIDISPQTGKFPAIQELTVNCIDYTSHANHELWDFSNLEYLEISLSNIEEMMQEIPPLEMPKIRKLNLSYPNFPSDREWQSHGELWRETVEGFLEGRIMPQLEELSISCFRPHLITHTLWKTAPRLKHLELTDTAQPSAPQKPTFDDVHVLLRGCPGLQTLKIDLSHLLLQLDSEVYKSTFCRFEDLKDLHITFNGSYCDPESTLLSDSEQLRYRSLLRRVKTNIVRWKAGVPLRRLRIKAYDIPGFGWTEGTLELYCSWDTEGKEGLSTLGAGTFEAQEMDGLDNEIFG